MAPGLKTLEEHKAYVEQLARVSFFFSWKIKEKTPGKSAGELLRDHTPLFFHALNYQDHESAWRNRDCLWIMGLADSSCSMSAAEFEERMYARIEDLAMKRAEQFYPRSVGMGVPPDWNVRSLKYDSPKSTLPPNYCCCHIANALSPRSIFDDPQHLPECFQELMDRSENEYGYDTLYTSSWLNDYPHWLKLFPQEWVDNLSPRSNDVYWHFGYWGQMVNARGTFNMVAGQYVREHCELRYKCRSSHCSFMAMRTHLKSIVGQAI